MSRLLKYRANFHGGKWLSFVLCCFLVSSCMSTPSPPPQPIYGPEYDAGQQHGQRLAAGEQRDYELVIYLHDNVIGDSTKEDDFQDGFVAGFISVKPEKERVAKESIKLAMEAAASFEYDHGKEIAQKVAQGTLADTTARISLKAARSLVDDLALKSGFIKGFGEGGEAMYYGLTR